MKLLLVRVGRGRYAVAADAVARILDPAVETDFHLEQTTGDAICQGMRYPVVDLHGAMGERAEGPGVYLLLEGPSRRAMVAVGGAEAIREVPADGIAPLPSFIFATARRFFRGIFLDEGEPRLLLDESGLL
jgi:chemotaxis signal transduction protein